MLISKADSSTTVADSQMSTIISNQNHSSLSKRGPAIMSSHVHGLDTNLPSRLRDLSDGVGEENLE